MNWIYDSRDPNSKETTLMLFALSLGSYITAEIRCTFVRYVLPLNIPKETKLNGSSNDLSPEMR